VQRGPEAIAGPRCTLWLARAVDGLPARLDVCVPAGRHPDLDGIEILRRRNLDQLRHPVLIPPRLRLEDAVLDVADRCQHPGPVIDLVLRVTQRRLSTAGRIRTRLEARRANRWRALVVDLLTDAHDGVQSPLERHYLHDIERAHGLPAGARNQRDVHGRYRDVRYVAFRLVVELDGREAHPDEARFRDRARDNRVVITGEVVLRYGWWEIVSGPCAIAVEVIAVLRRAGWTGQPRRCCPSCPVS
jgi:very-short-patch-repair endonuclease